MLVTNDPVRTASPTCLPRLSNTAPAPLLSVFLLSFVFVSCFCRFAVVFVVVVVVDVVDNPKIVPEKGPLGAVRHPLPLTLHSSPCHTHAFTIAVRKIVKGFIYINVHIHIHARI